MAIPVVAEAGGLQLATRGVRPTARGGAFIAGADGLESFGFNPAGLARLVAAERDQAAKTPSAKTPWHGLVDFGYVRQSASYTRIDSGLNRQPEVSNEFVGLPIPTIAVGRQLTDRIILAGGVYAPYAGLGKFPEDGPQRYSIVDLSESLLATTEVAVAMRVTDRLRVGAGVQNMVFFLASTVVFSACPGEVICAPEDPEFDAVGKVTQLSMINPSAAFGAQFDIADWIRVGAAMQLPFSIGGSGKIQTRLPSSGFFEGAQVRGDEAEVSFKLPMAVRAGIEFEPLAGWKAELATHIEFWSQHEEFLIEPIGVRIENAAGVGTYEIGDFHVLRNFEDTYSVNVGIEGKPVPSLPLTVRAGYAYETAAAPDAYLSVMTVDGDKHLMATGAGYQLGDWDLSGTLGLALVGSRTVTPEVGRAPQLSPIRDNSDEPLEVYVNWGDYSSFWLVIGAGASRSF